MRIEGKPTKNPKPAGDQGSVRAFNGTGGVITTDGTTGAPRGTTAAGTSGNVSSFWGKDICGNFDGWKSHVTTWRTFVALERDKAGSRCTNTAEKRVGVVTGHESSRVTRLRTDRQARCCNLVLSLFRYEKSL